MFLGFVTFLLAFLFINYKWGMVATPVLQFGMYSGKHHLSDTITVYRVEANGRLIEPENISEGENDFIQTYLQLYPSHKENNRVVAQALSKYLGVFNGTKSERPDTVTDQAFTAWFRQKMQRLVAEPISTLQATRQYFKWSDKRLVPLDSAANLTFLDAQ